MRFRISTSLHLGAFLLLGSFGAMPALANVLRLKWARSRSVLWNSRPV